MDIKRVLVKKPLVEFKLQSDRFYPATLLKCYEFSFSVDHFLSLNKVKKKNGDKLAPDVEIKSVTAASPIQLLNIISPPPV